MPLSETAKQSEHLAAMRWKTIPTPEDWKTASSSSRIAYFDKRKDSDIAAIDNAVREFGTISKQKVSLALESETLITLFEAIESYLAIPRGRGQNRREAPVRDLRAITLFTLSDIRWQKIRELTGGGRPGLKPMVPHVWSEMHSPGHARVGHDENSNQAPDLWLRGDDSAKEKYLFQYLRKVRQDHNAAVDGVRYLEDAERWEFQVVFDPQGFARRRFMEQKRKIINENQQLITSSGGDLGTSLYALDENDVFYMEMANQGQALNHCSFLAGRPVKCAGMIGVTQGVIRYIDNGSGHYRPTRQNLVNCLEALKQHVGRVIFAGVIVRDHSGRYAKAAYSAETFLATRGACLPIGWYQSAAGRYDTSLTFFTNDQEKRDFFAAQEAAVATKEFEKKIGELLKKLELSNRKGRLENDAERDILKRILEEKLRPFTVVSPYFKFDPPMQEWVAQRGYRA